jgi:hypothetical protein
MIKTFYNLLLVVYTCEYVYIYYAHVYRKSLLLLLCCHTKQVSGIRGFGFGDGLSSESVFDAVSGFYFGFQVWVRVHRDSIQSKTALLPSLCCMQHYQQFDASVLLSSHGPKKTVVNGSQSFGRKLHGP